MTLTLGQEISLPFKCAGQDVRASQASYERGRRSRRGLQTVARNAMGAMVSSSPRGLDRWDGTFTMNGVTPGEHTINGRSARANEGAEFANYTFTATGDPRRVRSSTSKERR